MKYFLYALCLALIVLKLTNFIDWSWWYVLMPLYGGAILWILLLIIAGTIKGIAEINKKKQINQIMDRHGVDRTKSKFQQRLDAYMEQQRKLKEDK